MSIFGEKEEEFEEDRDEELQKKFSSKKIKDLNPQNIRKRKESLKPWGKKERYFVLAVFVVTLLTASFLALSSRSWKIPGFKISFDFPKFELLKQETVVIGPNKNVIEEEKKKSEEIISGFIEKTKDLTGIYAFYVVDLNSGQRFGYKEKRLMQAASLIKPPVFTALYLEAEKGNINLDDFYILKNSDKREGSGSLQAKPSGTKISFREMAKLMGHESDNTAFNIIRNNLGDAKITLLISQVGMQNTSLLDNKTTAYDIGMFFEKLYKGEIVSSKSKDEILGYLTNTIYENLIPAGIPSVKVAHKYGREVNVTNDAGIVFGEKPFVLVFLSEGIIYKETDLIIPELARMVFEKLR